MTHPDGSRAFIDQMKEKHRRIKEPIGAGKKTREDMISRFKENATECETVRARAAIRSESVKLPCSSNESVVVSLSSE